MQLESLKSQKKFLFTSRPHIDLCLISGVLGRVIGVEVLSNRCVLHELVNVTIGRDEGRLGSSRRHT
jgi:hypothetical protein